MAKKNQRTARTKVAARSQSEIGSTSANFHEGTRSEYLAHYVFASFGTAFPVPSREDTGLDLYCTITERIGKRIWPTDYFAVQVKSGDDAWQFNSHKSVEWFIKFPLPMFLCVVTKDEARLRVYHTLPRYAVWATPGLPKAIQLSPGKDDVVGTIEQWCIERVYDLGPPILDFTIEDALDTESVRGYADVLRSWIRIDRENLFRISANMKTFQFPPEYTTNCALQDYDNTLKDGTEWKKVDLEDFQNTARRIMMPLAWLSFQLFERGDIAGATKGALLLRHLFEEEPPSPLFELYGRLTARVGKGTGRFAGIDAISDVINEFAPDLAGSRSR